MRPFYGGRKVAILDDADFLNLAGANGLLKTLEEPPPRQRIDFDFHQRRSATAHNSLASSNYPLSTAVRTDRRRTCCSRIKLSTMPPKRNGWRRSAAEVWRGPRSWRRSADVGISQRITGAVGATSAAKRGARASDHQVCRRGGQGSSATAGAAANGDWIYRRFLPPTGPTVGWFSDRRRTPNCDPSVERAARHGGWDIEIAGEAAQRSLEAITQVDRNANLHTAIEAWLDDVLLQSAQGAVSSGR